jgi:hypothetical protein
MEFIGTSSFAVSSWGILEHPAEKTKGMITSQMTIKV